MTYILMDKNVSKKSKKHEYLKLFQVYTPPEYCQSSRDKGGAYNKQIGTENSEI